MPKFNLQSGPSDLEIVSVTLRDQFAMAALPGVMATTFGIIEEMKSRSGLMAEDIYAAIAYAQADAMLAERERATHSAKEEGE